MLQKTQPPHPSLKIVSFHHSSLSNGPLDFEVTHHCWVGFRLSFQVWRSIVVTPEQSGNLNAFNTKKTQVVAVLNLPYKGGNTLTAQFLFSPHFWQRLPKKFIISVWLLCVFQHIFFKASWPFKFQKAFSLTAQLEVTCSPSPFLPPQMWCPRKGSVSWRAPGSARMLPALAAVLTLFSSFSFLSFTCFLPQLTLSIK